MMRPPGSRTILIAAAALMLLRAPGAYAESLQYGVDLGVGETDNVTLAATHPTSQTLATADLDFAVQHATRLFNLDATGNFTYLDFLQHAYTHELIGRFDGIGKLALIPERLTWVLQDDFGQAQVDPFAAVTPTNRENINYLSSGPDLNLRLGTTGFADLSGRYARAQYAVSPYDNNRAIGNLALGVELSTRSRISIDGATQRVRFDDRIRNVDFNRTSAYVDYELQGARTNVKLNLGETQVEQGSLSLRGPLAKLELTRQVTPSSTITLAGGRDLTDASTSFSTLTPGATGRINTSPAATSSANYTVTYGSAAWGFKRDRTAIRISGRWERDAYDGLRQLDLTRNDGEINLQRQLTRAASVDVSGSYLRTDYANVNFVDKDAIVGAGFIWRTGRAVELRLRYEHVARRVVGLGNAYDVNVVYLTVGYRPRPAADEANAVGD